MRWFLSGAAAVLLVVISALSYFAFTAQLGSQFLTVFQVLAPSLATILTAVVALMIYASQQATQRLWLDAKQDDEKARLASTIYKEIKSAENAIEKIRAKNVEKIQQYGPNSFSLINETAPPILPYESWTKHKHLFVGALSSEHFDTIDQSFEAAIQAEDCRAWALDLFRYQAQEKARARVDAVNSLTKELVVERLRASKGHPTVPGLLDDGIDNIKDACEKEFYRLTSLPSEIFVPKELGDRAEQALESFKPIINTPAGQALKQLCQGYSL